MSQGKGNIVIISSNEGIIIRGLEKKLQGAGYSVDYVGMDTDKLLVCLPVADVFVLYLNGIEGCLVKIINQVDTYAAEHNIPILVVGEKEDKDAFHSTVAMLTDQKWFARPLDMDEFIEYIDNIIINSAEEKTESSKKNSLLIVDDDPMFGKIMCEWLKAVYHVKNVTSGMEAISLLATEHVDLILLDYEMPILSGPKVLEMFRADSRTKDIPVVFLTGISDKESISKVLEFKPQGYFLKTTPKMELLGWLSNFFA